MGYSKGIRGSGIIDSAVAISVDVNVHAWSIGWDGGYI